VHKSGGLPSCVPVMGVLVGWMCAAIAVLFFGSNFTVVAKYDAGDGMFFQLVLCIGIWCTGLVVFLLRSTPVFYPMAMTGGVIWCTGNCCTVYVIKSIGLGPGLVTWGTASLLIGWLTGFFGLFGIPSERHCLAMPWLNVVGFCISVCALIDSTLIKKGAPLRQVKTDASPIDISLLPASQEPVEAGNTSLAPTALVADDSEVPPRQRYIAMLIATGMGCCYGANFLPSTWIQDNVAGASKDGLDYVFNQFCGILLASIIYFLMYCVYKGNKPVINPEIVVPGFLSGVMWAVAQTCWFVANTTIGYSAAFPIILIGPGFIGSMWSVFLFKDIYGARNYRILAGYFVLAVSACTCIVLSRKSDASCS